ncbi:MAG: hypothetical protein A2152_03940 [Candidatus Levybacteria bacterium RBG_16_35_6]|nr:MAG: hypothetical protein A2152_03940 [Candidatus Levybacteria bacterium RBG_16_35_6]
MKKLLIVANWKSNKTHKEAKKWLTEFLNFKQQITNLENKEIIVCPSYTLLAFLKLFTSENNLAIKIGSQDLSSFSTGAHTGEVNSEQIKEFADFTIIGHSERRRMGEGDEALKQKVEKAKESGLEIIYCVSDLNQVIPGGIEIVAYEPIFAIGSGNPDTPENAQKTAEMIKGKTGVKFVLYGGSVTSKNVDEFTKMEGIDGVLVGGASLDPVEFSKLILNS